MNFILLLGAGFTRNWGGWLASEALEYLLGYPDLNTPNRDLLLKHKDIDGFEGALSELQSSKPTAGVTEDLINLQNAVRSMFNDMNKGLRSAGLDTINKNTYLDQDLRIPLFLHKFDVIFSLNQDLLLEHHYINRFSDPITEHLPKPRILPGITPNIPDTNARNNSIYTYDCLVDDVGKINIPEGTQPYIKLHGSSNWRDSSNRELMIIGGNKSKDIQNFPILSWYSRLFEKYLNLPNTRLMVIGYSFSDFHINFSILEASQNYNLKIFIIDPLGTDVLDKRATKLSHDLSLTRKLWLNIIGASRRSLREIFANENPELNKIMKFFEK